MARCCLPQLTTQEGYKKAIKLVNEQYSQLRVDHASAIVAGKAMMELSELVKNGPTPQLKDDDTINTRCVTLQVEDHRSNEIKEVRFRLGTYGLTGSRDCEKSLKTMNNVFNTLQAEGTPLWQLLVKDYELQSNAQIPSLSYNKIKTPHCS